MVARAGLLFDRLVVLLDALAPDGGAFAQALDWGTRLGLPLYAVGPLEGDGEAAETSSLHPGRPGHANGLPRIRACAEVCARRAVRWETAPGALAAVSGWGELLRPADLCLVSSASWAVLGPDLLRHRASVLLCPRKPAAVGRVLILCQEDHPGAGFLTGAVGLTQALGARPIVLTVARSERVALLRQQAARQLLQGDGSAADFDLLVSADLRAAVAGVARWRGCQLVILERSEPPPWWRRLGGWSTDPLLDLGDTLGILALPPVRARDGSARAADGSAAGACQGER